MAKRAKNTATRAKRIGRNPYEGAAALSEAFHGRPAKSVTEYVSLEHEHGVLADLGRLLSIRLGDGTTIRFDRHTRLASNESGTQLYAVGGDQSVDLAQFDVDATKESVCLGEIRDLDYETAKFHLDKEDEIKGPYTHRLGEESGAMPLLCYDAVNHTICFVGGAYHIDVDMDGGFSAGIRN